MGSKKRFGMIMFLALTSIFLLVPPVVSIAEQDVMPETINPQPAVPQPQGFCGYCHILTYPAVINKSYETWKKGKHNKMGCAECHYSLNMNPATGLSSSNFPIGQDSHIPEAPPGHFSYLELGGKTVKTVPQISDTGCLTVACHGKPEDTFRSKKIAYTEKIPFVHESHFKKENQIAGMRLNCTTCHQHETEGKHFEVAEATCHLCHFGNSKFN